MAEKVDKRKENSGKKKDQKMKPFLVYDYLMRESDFESNHTNPSFQMTCCCPVAIEEASK